MAAVAAVRQELAQAHEHRDLEAETAHRINQLVARMNAWRNGNIRTSGPTDGVEIAAS